MVKIRSLLFVLFFCMLSSVAHACAAGYESTESLVKKAGQIIFVEVVSTSDVPKPEGKNVWRGDEGPASRKNACAEVKVTGSLLAECKIKKLTIIGGPYYTCAPFDSYIRFEKGETFALILSEPLDENTNTVIVTWCGRVCGGTKETMEAYIKGGRLDFEKECSRYKKVYAKEFERAETLFEKIKKGTITFKDLEGENYTVLYIFNVLLQTPNEKPLFSEEKKEAAMPVYYAGSICRGIINAEQAEALSSAMDNAEKKEGNQKKKIEDAIEYIQLHDELCLPDEIIKKYREEKNRESKIVKAVDMLKRLTAYEPDGLVWGTLFGVKFDTLDPEIFIPYLKKNKIDISREWEWFSLLLSMPHPEIKPYIDKAWAEEDSEYRYEKYLQFYLAIKDFARCVEILDRYAGQYLDVDFWGNLDPEKIKSAYHSANYYVKIFSELIRNAEEKNSELNKKLDELEQKLKSAKEKYSISEEK